MPKLRVKASALAVVSLTSTPRKSTPADLYCSAATASVGASSRHGPHQEPQKLTTTTWPRYEAKFSLAPVSVVAVKSGASGWCPAVYSTALGLPSTSVTSRCPLPAHPATSTMTSAAAASTAAPKTTRRRLVLNTGESLELLQGVVLTYCAASPWVT